MSGADLRAFAYVLEPVRRRRQWQLDAVLAQLAELRRQMLECESEQQRLHQECVTQAAQASRLWMERADPSTHAGLIGYLAALHQRGTDAQRELAKLTELVEQARQACALQQQRVELMNQHRSRELTAYVTEQHRKAGVQADHDWLARHSCLPSETVAV